MNKVTLGRSSRSSHSHSIKNRQKKRKQITVAKNIYENFLCLFFTVAAVVDCFFSGILYMLCVAAAAAFNIHACVGVGTFACVCVCECGFGMAKGFFTIQKLTD